VLSRIGCYKYIKEMLNKFNMEYCNPFDNPMITSCKLSKDDQSPKEDYTMYRPIIGNILFVTASRHDVMQAVRSVAIFQSATKECHAIEIKRILVYLKGTMDFGLWYPKGENLTLTTYINENWEGNIDDKKSTSGGVFILGRYLVSWLIKK
jgi:hypothetical protein